MAGPKIKVVIAKPGLDGHDRGVKIIARALVEAGMEVVYLGLQQTPESIVQAAVEEDADVIGLSILSGAHLTHFKRVKELMDKSGLGDRLLTGGGIIPTKDQEKLKEMGVGKVFGPGEDIQNIVEYIRKTIQERREGGSWILISAEEQQMVIDGAKKFAEKELAPAVEELDAKQEFNLAALKKLGELGYLGMTVPEEHGGTGLGMIAYAGAMIEFSKVDAGTAVGVSVQNSLVNDAVILFGTEEQKKKYLPKLASGEWLGCFSLTEAGAGSDPGSLRASAVRQGDSYLLNGTKNFTSNGAIADVIIAFFCTDKEKGAKGISAFLVPKETPGYAVGKHENKLGIRTSSTTELVFTDCLIPAGSLLGQENRGLEHRPGDIGLRPGRHRGPGHRHRRSRPGRSRPLLERKDPVRQAAFRISGPAVHAGRHGRGRRGGQNHALPRRLDEGLGNQALHQGVGHDQTVRLGNGPSRLP